MLAISMTCWTFESVRAQGSISVFTDKSSYQLHEAVTFHGYVSGLSDVMVYIYTPDVDPHVHKDSFDWAIRREGVSGYYSCTYNGERTNNKVGTWTANAVMYHPTHPGEKLGEAWVTWEVVGEGQNQPPPEVKTLSVNVEKTLGDTYQPGEDVYFSGRVTCNGAGVEGASIEIVVANSAGQSGTPGHKVSDSNGFYGSLVHLPEDIAAGTYTIKVTAHKDGYTDGTDDTSFTVETKTKALSVTVKLDKGTYAPGENVLISGRVTFDGAGVEGAELKTVVSNSAGQTGNPGRAYSDSNGYYSSKISLSQDSVADTYTITVTASKEGYESATAKTAYTVVVNEAAALLVTVDAYSESKPGDYVIVNVFVNYKTASGYEPVSEADVSLSVSPSMGLSSWTGEADPAGYEGVYDGSFTIPVDAPPGPYILTATASKTGFKTGSGTFSFTVNGPDTLVVTVETDKKTYVRGDTVTITGYLKIKDEYLSGVTVTIAISNTEGSIGPYEVETVEGRYEQAFVLQDRDPSGPYNVKVSVPKSTRYKEGSADCSFYVEEARTGPLTFGITVALDRMVYNPGDPVTVTGSISSGGESMEGATVTIEIQGPGGGLPAQTITLGALEQNYEKTIGLPEKASPGSYTVIVRVSKEGYKDGSAKTSFTVEPSTLKVTVIPEYYEIYYPKLEAGFRYSGRGSHRRAPTTR